MKWNCDLYSCPHCEEKEIIISMPLLWGAVIAIKEIVQGKAQLYEKGMKHSDILWNCNNCYHDGRIIIR